MSATTRALSSDPYSGREGRQYDISDPFGPVLLAPHIRHNAALTVAEMARGADDARLLLDVLGLDDEEMV